MSLEKLIDLDRLSRFKNELVALIPQIDTTLTQQGQAADAKATGDALAEKQPKPYMFGVFHDIGDDPEYVVTTAPRTIGEIIQLIYGEKSVSLEIVNMDSPEATYYNGEIYPLGTGSIGVLFKRMEPVVNIQTITLTGANANAVGLVGSYSGSNGTDSEITWVFYDLGNRPLATQAEIPTNVSDLTNDAGYLTSYTETDPTVPAWAKASAKPTYTAVEVGALPSSTVIPSAETDANVEDMLDSFGLDYTSSTTGVNEWTGGEY